VRVLSLIQALRDADCDVDLVSFSEPDADIEEAREYLSRLGVSCLFVRRSIHDRSRIAQLGVRARAAASGKPYAAAVTESREMTRRVQETLRSSRYGVVVAETSWMGQYVADVRGLRKILSWQNVDFDVYALRAAAEKRPLLRAIRNHHSRVARRFELGLVPKFDAVAAVTEADRRKLLTALPNAPATYVLPVSVDTKRFAYHPPREKPGERLLFVGSMFYQPNIDAVLHFHREIYPLIRQKNPGVSLTIVGKDPTPAVRDLAKRDRSVQVTGTVPRVEDFYRDADLFVVPIRFGGGMKTKVIEAMACGVPIVGSPTAFEGISVTHGREAVVADTPSAFARSAVELLASPAARSEMSLNARSLVEEHYSQKALTCLLKAILEKTVPA